MKHASVRRHARQPSGSAKARFAVYGTSVDPDATFTLRLSYGSVKGFQNAAGVDVAPYTTMVGLFNRATGALPYALPQSWLTAKPNLNLTTPMNLSSTNDIIGGNSGSPLIDKAGEVVGLIFDGNIFSLGGNFGYEPTHNRAVAVDSRALLSGLRSVYHADRLVSEIEAGRKIARRISACRSSYRRAPSPSGRSHRRLRRSVPRRA